MYKGKCIFEIPNVSMMKTNQILTGLCLVVISCCKDTNKPINIPAPSLPAISSEGKNTFGCLINGELYLPKGSYNHSYYSWHDEPNFYGTFSMNVNRKQPNDNSNFTIELRNRVFTIGKHLVYANPNTKNYLFHSEGSSPPAEYENFTLDSNNFIHLIRLDTINRIAAGTFQFSLVNNNNILDTVKVTEGRFDFTY